MVPDGCPARCCLHLLSIQLIISDTYYVVGKNLATLGVVQVHYPSPDEPDRPKVDQV